MKFLVSIAAVCLCCGPAWGQAGGSVAAGGAKIGQALLCTPQPGAQFSLSPLGIHMAKVTQSGSRMVVIYSADAWQRQTGYKRLSITPSGTSLQSIVGQAGGMNAR